jgi:hypothetical protein
VLSAAAAIVLMVRDPHPFAARGGALDDHSQVIVYRSRAGAPGVRIEAGAQFRAQDELAFVYRNPEGYERLAVFAVDEHRHIYWYYPAWLDAATNPAMIAITSSPAPVELGEAVSHAFDGHQLKLYALFSHRSLTVRQIEKVFADRHEASALPRDGRIMVLDLLIERAGDSGAALRRASPAAVRQP